MKMLDYGYMFFLFAIATIASFVYFTIVMNKLSDIEENQGYATSAIITEVMRYRSE